MISRSAEYALRAAACLAEHHGRAITTHHIAEVTNIPASYLAKIMRALVRAGVVASQRGLNGGFVLARRPQEVTLLEVVRVCDEPRTSAECPLHLRAHCANPCPLHRHLGETAARMAESLASITLAALSAETAGGKA